MASGRAGHGVVYTRPRVAELVLDLCGYDPDENLVDAVAVEPSCGTGEFLEPMVRRLSESCRRHGRPLPDCAGSIRAYELDPEAAEASRKRVRSVLIDEGWAVEEAEVLRPGEGERPVLRRGPSLSRHFVQAEVRDFVPQAGTRAPVRRRVLRHHLRGPIQPLETYWRAFSDKPQPRKLRALLECGVLG